MPRIGALGGGKGGGPAATPFATPGAPVFAMLTPPGAIRRPARQFVHATAAVVGVSLALSRRIRI